MNKVSNDGSDLNRTLDNIVAAASGPFETAVTMPPTAYTSLDIYELERKHIFETQWVCVGRVDELSKQGDFFTTRVADEPLVILRNDDDEIIAMSNVCRHKWTQLLDGCGNTKRIVCPYHAWTYDLKGCLVHSKFMDRSADFNESEIYLPRVSCDVWRGFIYVRLADKGEKISSQLSGLDARTFDYHMEEMTLICGEQEVWANNWKLLAENFTETYHVFHTHRDSIAHYTPTELTEIQDGDAAHSFGVSPLLKDAMPESPFEPFHPDLSEQHQNEFCMIGVYPNQMIALAPDRFFYMCLTPEGPAKVRTKWGVACYEKEALEDAVKGIEDIYRTINEEDKLRLERIQTSLNSRFARQGSISCYEKMNWEFTGYIARHICMQENKLTL